jgi:hypothetical protein
MIGDRHSRAQTSPLEKLVNRMPSFITLSLSFALVAILGVLFDRGDQIYPVFNDIPATMDCPECRVFNNTYAEVRERQFRIFFDVIAPLEVTRKTAWKLLRLKIYGPYFSQELRNADNCGIYDVAPRLRTLHFELAQEGPTQIEMYCLDDLIINTTNVVAPWARETPYSVHHANGDLTNVCLSAGSLKVFVRGWVFSQNSLGNVTFVNAQIVDHARRIGLREVVFMFRLTALDLQEMSSVHLFEFVILVAFVQSQLCESVFFKDPTDGFPTALSIIKKVANGRLTTHVDLCAKKVTVNPDFSPSLSIASLNQMRALATEKYHAHRTNVVVVNHAPIFETLLREPGIEFVDISNYTDLKAAVKLISTARAMVSLDDADHVINAFWLPVDAPLVLVMAPRRRRYSPAVARLLGANITITGISGDVDGAVSAYPELFARCTSGVLDPEAAECDLAYSNLSFTVSTPAIVGALT